MTQNNRTPERLLLIGCTAFTGIDSVSWTAKAFPNIPDYDLVIVSVPHITQDYLQIIDSDIFTDIKKDLVEFLHSGGKLVVLLSPVLQVKRPEKYPEWVSNQDWCPVTFSTPEEAGQSIVSKRNLYESYLHKMTKWSFYITVSNKCLSTEITNFYGSTHDTMYKMPFSPYLENRYGRILAGETHVEIRKEIRQRDGWGKIRTEYPNEPDYVTGNIVVLPLLDGMTPEEALLAILQEEIGYSLKSPAPDWAQEIAMPRVPDLTEKVSLAETTIEREKKNICELKEQIEQLVSFRRLLFGTGTELEDVVKKSFELCGATVIPAKYAQEEYILEVNGREYLMEVKGISKSISLGHLRQLNDYLLKYQEDTGNECKGILLGNAWRNMPPDMRNKDDTPEFPDNVVKRAEQLGVSLVSSLTLFDAVIRVLEERALGSELVNALTSANGIARI